MALSVNNEAYTFLIADSKSFSPVIFKKVSCCPAKEAVGKSSAVAEERTATERFCCPPSLHKAA